MRKTAAALLAVLTAFSATAMSSTGAEARRYRHSDGAVAIGIATAVIAGIALSRHHRHHRYYSDYDDGYYSYRPRRIYRSYYYDDGYYPRSRAYAYGGHHRGYSGHYRSYNPAYPHFHGRHIHARP